MPLLFWLYAKYTQIVKAEKDAVAVALTVVVAQSQTTQNYREWRCSGLATLTGAQMKYLHVIYAIQTKEGIRCVDISRQLCVTMASVSRMVRVLSDSGLTTLNAGKIKLTSQGRIEAGNIDEKLEHLTRFFSEYLLLDAPEAVDSAYAFLCNFTVDCVDRLIRKDWTGTATV